MLRCAIVPPVPVPYREPLFERLYHEILNEPERDRVVSDIADWLDAHTQD